MGLPAKTPVPVTAKRALAHATALAALPLVTFAVPDPADAATCAPTQVSAKGEVARFRWLAVMKARGNWRSKVRTIPGLGADYADFGRSADQIERCISDQRTIVCTVTARPCSR